MSTQQRCHSPGQVGEPAARCHGTLIPDRFRVADQNIDRHASRSLLARASAQVERRDRSHLVHFETLRTRRCSRGYRARRKPEWSVSRTNPQPGQEADRCVDRYRKHDDRRQARFRRRPRAARRSTLSHPWLEAVDHGCQHNTAVSSRRVYAGADDRTPFDRAHLRRSRINRMRMAMSNDRVNSRAAPASLRRTRGACDVRPPNPSFCRCLSER